VEGQGAGGKVEGVRTNWVGMVSSIAAGYVCLVTPGETHRVLLLLTR
jgi:hypothetical protein